MVKAHVCEDLLSINSIDASDTVRTISSVSSNEKDNWELDLYDGNGVQTKISFCPFCGEKLQK